MPNNVIYWPYPTPLEVPVKRVLEAAADCQAVLILGIDADGAPYRAGSIADKATLLFWIEQFRHKLLQGDFDG